MQVRLCGINDRIAEEARQKYPNECCGVLLGCLADFEVREIRTLDNAVDVDKRNVHFAISPLALYEVERLAEKSGLEIVGFFHSHPDCKAVPSSEDQAFMIPKLAYVIVSVQNGDVVDARAYYKPTPATPAFEIETVIQDKEYQNG